MRRPQPVGTAADPTGGVDQTITGPPFALQVEVTSRCNLKCRMCPLTTGGTSSSMTPGDMDDAAWDTVLELAVRARQVFIAGFGEPFSNRRCLQLLGELDAAGVAISLVTNGVAVTPAVAAGLTRLRSIVHVNVSIDSPDAECYRAVRGGSLERALRGLRNIMAAIDDPLRVSVSSVAMATTIATLPAFPALLASMGVRQYLVQGLWDYNDYSLDHRLSGRRAFDGILERIVAEGACHGVDVQLTLDDRSRREMADPEAVVARYSSAAAAPEADRTRQCTLPWELPYVDKDGRVFSCCYAASVGAPELGRLGTDSFTAIWGGPTFSRFRQDLLDGRTMPAACRDCTAVPLGRHPLVEYWAEIERVERLRGRMRVTARNRGTAPWTAGEIYVGTSRPRDCRSPVAHPSWLRPERPCTFAEGTVAPGDRATFEFSLGAAAGAGPAHFALVAEHVCWLPGTEFSLPSGR